MKIYIAGKYSDKTKWRKEKNVKLAYRVAAKILLKGHWPFIPHHTHWFDYFARDYLGLHFEKEMYYEWDNQFLAMCDGFVKISESPGANEEERLAQKLGLTIFNSIEDIPKV